MNKNTKFLARTYLYACKRLLIDINNDTKLVRTYSKGNDVGCLIHASKLEKLKIISLTFNIEKINKELRDIAPLLPPDSSQTIKPFFIVIDDQSWRARELNFKIRGILEKINNGKKEFSYEEVKGQTLSILNNVTIRLTSTDKKRISSILRQYSQDFINGILEDKDNPTICQKTYEINKHKLVSDIAEIAREYPINNLCLNELTLAEAGFNFIETVFAMELEGLLIIRNLGFRGDIISSAENYILNENPRNSNYYFWIKIEVTEKFKDYYTKEFVPYISKNSPYSPVRSLLCTDSKLLIEEESDLFSAKYTEQEAYRELGDIMIYSSTLNGIINNEKFEYKTLSSDEKRGVRFLFVLLPDVHKENKEHKVGIGYKEPEDILTKELTLLSAFRMNKKIGNRLKYARGSLTRARSFLKKQNSTYTITKSTPYMMEIS